MPTYSETNDYTGLDATVPLGSEPPSNLDNALRETRLVAKTVTMKGHTSTGIHKVARRYTPIANAAGLGVSAAVNTWAPAYTLADVTEDAHSILQVPDYTGAFKPVAGKYLINFFMPFWRVEYCMCAMRTATGASTSTALSAMLGNLAFANKDAPPQSIVMSQGQGLWTTDGTVNLFLAYIVSDVSAGTVAAQGFSPTVPAGFVTGANVSSVTFLQLYSV